MNWIILEESEKKSNSTYLLKSTKFEHIHFILKKTKGDELRVLIPGFGRGKGNILNIDSNSVLIEFLEINPPSYSSKQILLKTELVLPLPRPQTGKKILHLAGCFGVEKINFLLPDSKNREFLTSPVYKQSGYWKEIKTGMEQSGNFIIPSISLIHKDIVNYCQTLEKKFCITLDSTGMEAFYDILQFNSYDPIASEELKLKLLFGSESGFSEKEILYLNSISKVYHLGNTILRTEYAVSNVLGLLQSKRR